MGAVIALDHATEAATDPIESGAVLLARRALSGAAGPAASLPARPQRRGATRAVVPSSLIRVDFVAGRVRWGPNGQCVPISVGGYLLRAGALLDRWITRSIDEMMCAAGAGSTYVEGVIHAPNKDRTRRIVSRISSSFFSYERWSIHQRSR